MTSEVDQNMAEEGAKLPDHAVPDPQHDGWYCWPHIPPGKFAGQLGVLSFRPDGPGQARVMMQVEDRHMNPGGSIHGGAVMSFIDMALFAGGRCAGMTRAHYVTLDCATRFLSRGTVGKPLVAHVRLVRETRGGIVFLAGHLEQDGEVCYDFTGTLKRFRAPEDRK